MPFPMPGMRRKCLHKVPQVGIILHRKGITMAYTETTRQSWISRLGDSLRGILFGLAIFCAGVYVIFWNEGNTVRTARALDEGQGACVHADSIENVDPGLDGRLVHLSGKVETDAPAGADEVFGISENALMLRRNVEMFQWVERSSSSTKKNLGGSATTTTTYTYGKEWSDDIVDSDSFKEAGHDNPKAMPWDGETHYAPEARVGAYRLTDAQIRRIGQARGLSMGQDYACPVTNAQRRGNSLYFPATGTDSGGRDVAANPQIGDVRVSFDVVYPHEITVVAKQYGDTFVPFLAKSGKKVDMLADGVLDMEGMFERARSGNKTQMWLLRLVGFLMLLIGANLVLKPLGVLVDVLPFLGSVVSGATGIVAFLFATVCALVAVAIAWVAYRPAVAIGALAAAAAVVVLFRKLRAGRQSGVSGQANP